MFFFLLEDYHSIPMASEPLNDTTAAPRKVCLKTFYFFTNYGCVVILPVFSDKFSWSCCRWDLHQNHPVVECQSLKSKRMYNLVKLQWMHVPILGLLHFSLCHSYLLCAVKWWRMQMLTRLGNYYDVSMYMFLSKFCCSSLWMYNIYRFNFPELPIFLYLSFSLT